MKVVHINIFSSVGSTGSIIESIISKCEDENIESYVIYGRGLGKIDNHHIKPANEMIMKFQSLQSKITGNSYGGCFYSTSRIINILEQLKPDVVHLHSINGHFVNIYRLIEYLKKKNISTVLTLHAEFMYTGNCSHAYDCMKWVNGCHNCNRKMPERPKSFFFDKSKSNWKKLEKAYKGFNKLEIVAVSGWVKSRAQMSPFFSDKRISIITNGVDTSIFNYNEKSKYYKKQLIKTDNCKVLLYLTPNFEDPLKGGEYIVELAKRLQNKKIKIIIGGKNIPMNLPDNIINIGYVSEKEKLAELYSAADITLLTSRGETFSMVCAESLCCGTPVVGFKAGGPETIALHEASKFVEYGDGELLNKEIEKMLSKELSKKDISYKATVKYNKDIMVDKYITTYKKIYTL